MVPKEWTKGLICNIFKKRQLAEIQELEDSDFAATQGNHYQQNTDQVNKILIKEQAGSERERQRQKERERFIHRVTSIIKQLNLVNMLLLTEYKLRLSALYYQLVQTNGHS